MKISESHELFHEHLPNIWSCPLILLNSEISGKGIFSVFDHLKDVFKSNSSKFIFLNHEGIGVFWLNLIRYDFFFDETLNVFIEVTLLKTFGIQTFQEFNNCFFWFIDGEIFIAIQEIFSKFDINSVGFSDIKEILWLVAIFSQKDDFCCEEGHIFSNFGYLFSVFSDRLLSFYLLSCQLSHLFLIFIYLLVGLPTGPLLIFFYQFTHLI